MRDAPRPSFNSQSPTSHSMLLDAIEVDKNSLIYVSKTVKIHFLTYS